MIIGLAFFLYAQTPIVTLYLNLQPCPYLINKVCLAISKTNFYGHREKIVSRNSVD